MSTVRDCPICGEPYDDRTDLRVHLEVNHRKSEIVTEFIGALEADVNTSADDDADVAKPEPTVPSAD